MQTWIKSKEILINTYLLLDLTGDGDKFCFLDCSFLQYMIMYKDHITKQKEERKNQKILMVNLLELSEASSLESLA